MEYNDGAFRQPGDNVFVDIDSGTSTTYKESALRFQHASTNRFIIEKDNVANADLYIRRYNSSGVLQDNPFKIAGDTGNITLTQTGTFSIAYDASNHIDITVSSAGAGKITAVGTNDSIELETGDGKIILDAKTDIDLDPEGNDINLLGSGAGKITLAAASMTIYGGDTTGDDLLLYANTADANYIQLDGTTITTAGKHAFGGITDWGVGATGSVIDGTGYDWTSQTIARVNSNLNSTAAAAGYHAMAVTASQTTTNSIFGTWTELYITGGTIDLTGSSNYASVWGNLEISGTVTSTDTDDFMSSVHGSLTTPANYVNNTAMCGCHVDSTVNATITNNGRFSAFECKASTRAWDYGVYLANTINGINIVDSTMAIDATASMTGASGINGTEFNITDSTTASSGYARGIWLNMTADGAKTGTAETNGLGIDLTISANSPFARALTLYTVSTGTTTIGTTSALDIYMDDDAGTVTQTGKRAINIGIDHGEDKGTCDMIVMRCHGGTVDNVFKFTDTTGSPYTNFVSIDGVCGFVHSGSLDDSGASDILCDAYITCDVGGTPYYLPLYNTTH